MGLLSFKAFTLQEAASTKKYHPTVTDYMERYPPEHSDGKAFDFDNDINRPGFDYKTNHPSFKTATHYHEWVGHFKHIANTQVDHGSPSWHKYQG